MKFFNILRKNKHPYLFILPFFILFFVFKLYPVIWTLKISFTKWNGIKDPEFIGLENYKNLFKDYMFWDAIKNTMIYWLVGGFFIIILALLLSLLLNYKKLKGRRFFKIVTFLPNISAAIAMGLIFGMLFDQNVGIINEIIGLFGIEDIGWLTSTRFSKIPVLSLYIWRHTPWFALIILTALLKIPIEFYEAAKIDGANRIQQFIMITLPNISRILFFCFIIVTVNSWKMFNESYILKGPGTSNISLFQYLYQSGFNIFKMGYASAIGVILTLILAVVSIIQFLVRKRNSEI
jgi:ABC-type sugar transport system permease subunit